MGGGGGGGCLNVIPFQGELVGMKCSPFFGVLLSSVCVMDLGESQDRNRRCT